MSTLVPINSNRRSFIDIIKPRVIDGKIAAVHTLSALASRYLRLFPGCALGIAQGYRALVARGLSD
ncbi:hypothetical protein [Pseudomonas petrae]|uniref:Uncharacterized protein n=1 Tax=Pseudomonas petrae TaxID=2912190 RepID=A0ABS9I7H1_9PSED|nr:hypothetical protein [Pseudomonas petrae]MCF7532702.1 hypothetical protein [Pseudomonas petrae]MCF7538881.1 hypothetical protein [Pseudomonas petrae]MCF7543702.1 hypothetical protein [Pseudomonas petrae]MCF7557075.1 hypothetical protein [Pseudomonas petrae]